MKKISSHHQVTKEFIDHFSKEELDKMVKLELASSITQFLFDEKLIDIKKEEKIFKGNGFDKCIFDETETFSTEFYIMKPEELKEIMECLSYIHRNTFNYELDAHTTRIYNILKSAND